MNKYRIEDGGGRTQEERGIGHQWFRTTNSDGTKVGSRDRTPKLAKDWSEGRSSKYGKEIVDSPKFYIDFMVQEVLWKGLMGEVT